MAYGGFGAQQQNDPAQRPKAYGGFGAQQQNNPAQRPKAYGGFRAQQQNDPAQRPKAYGGFGAQQQNDPAQRPKAYGGFGAQQQNDPAQRPKAYGGFGAAGGFGAQQQNDPAQRPKAYGGFRAQQQNDPAWWPNYSPRSPTKAYAGGFGGYRAQWQNDRARPPNYPPRPNPIVVINPTFCAPDRVDLVVCKTVISYTESSLTFTDVKGNVKFKVKGLSNSIGGRPVLLDAYDHNIISFQKTVLTECERQAFRGDNFWQAFKGNSSYLNDPLFSVKKSSVLQYSYDSNLDLDVSLAANTKCVYDFKIKGNWSERSFTIYASDGNTIIAQMHKKQNAPSIYQGNDTFGITVNPHVDYAFIVALVVILYDIKGKN